MFREHFFHNNPMAWRVLAGLLSYNVMQSFLNEKNHRCSQIVCSLRSGSDLLSCLHLESHLSHTASYKNGVSYCTTQIYMCFCPEVVLWNGSEGSGPETFPMNFLVLFCFQKSFEGPKFHVKSRQIKYSYVVFGN